jgi:hypothetical protein
LVGQQLSHERQSRPAQQQAHRAVAPLGGQLKGALDKGKKRRSGLGEERDLSITTGFGPFMARRISRVTASSHPPSRKGVGSSR